MLAPPSSNAGQHAEVARARGQVQRGLPARVGFIYPRPFC